MRIVDTDATITDDLNALSEVKVTIVNPFAGSGEGLSLTAAQLASATAAGISVAGNGTATLTLSGTATPAAYQTLLRQITFENPSVAGGGNGADRTVTIVAKDSLGVSSAVATTTIDITVSNGAPVIGTSSTLTATVTEDATNTVTGTVVRDRSDWRYDDRIDQLGWRPRHLPDHARGNWSYDLNEGSLAIQSLDTGDTLTETFNIQVSATETAA